MQQRRILFYLCLAAAGMTCGSLMIGSIGASRNRPELEPNAMDPVHSTQISSHVKSVDKYQDEAQLSASTAPLKGPAGPDVVASITHQIPIVDEVSEGLSDWPQTADPVSPSPTGDAQASARGEFSQAREYRPFPPGRKVIPTPAESSEPPTECGHLWSTSPGTSFAPTKSSRPKRKGDGDFRHRSDRFASLCAYQSFKRQPCAR